MSQEYVANYLGVRRAAIAEIESGKRKVSSDELAKYSELFLVSADELLNGTKAESPTQVFARSFSALDESDQKEILNLIEFKRMVKNGG